MAKIMTSIIIRRLDPWYNSQLTTSQNGFRRSYGTNDAILRTKMIQQIAHKLDISVYLLFIDLSSAFDTIVRKWLFRAIRIRLPEESDTTIIDILEKFYDTTTAYTSNDPN